MSETTKASFRDLNQREWTIRLDVPLVRRIAEVTGIKLTDLRADPFLRMSTDPCLLVDVLWLLCERQAKEAGISDIQFGEAIGDQIDAATEAMQDAIVNFSHSSKRSLLRSLIAENSTMQTEAMTMAMTDLKAERGKIVSAMARRSKAEIAKLLESIEPVNSEASDSSTSLTDGTP